MKYLVLDNMHDVRDIKASSSDSCSHQNWHPSSLEVFQCLEKNQSMELASEKIMNQLPALFHLEACPRGCLLLESPEMQIHLISKQIPLRKD